MSDEARICFHYSPALFARAQFLRRIKLTKARKKILFDIFQVEPVLMQFTVAIVAIPNQSVEHIYVFSLAFNYQPDGISRPLRTVWCIGGQKKHFTFFDRYINRLTILLYPDIYLPFELVKQLFGFIVMVIFPGVRTTYDHYNIVAGIGIEVFISYGRLQQITIVSDPLF